MNVTEILDFIVEVEEGRDITVLQISDPQLADSTQLRPADSLRLDDYSKWYNTPDKREEKCFSFIRKTIEAVKPDFMFVAGDLVRGDFDDDGSSFLAFIEFMEGFDIPWAPVFGNHDNESMMGADWQCEQLEKAPNCLFRQRTLTGNGNYTVGIKQGNEIKRVFVMLDTNACSVKTNWHSTTRGGLGNDQIEWYTEIIKSVTEISPDTKYSMVFHIPMQSFLRAFEGRGFCIEDKWDTDDSVWEGFKELGVDSVFVGHDHLISASVMYDGILCQFGQKSSTYDCIHYLQEDGAIVASYRLEGKPLVGGTVVPVSREDGTIKEPYIVMA